MKTASDRARLNVQKAYAKMEAARRAYEVALVRMARAMAKEYFMRNP